MTLYELPAAIISSGEKRRADAELRMFENGHDFFEIKEVLAGMAAQDQRIATAIRDAIPHMRGLSWDDQNQYLKTVLDSVPPFAD
jgi:hypothetical protein